MCANCRWGAVALSALAFLACGPQARADLITGSGADAYAVLGQFSNNQTNYNNGNIVGNVGIGSPRAFTISNANLTGNVDFSGAANTSGFLGGSPPNNVSGGGSFIGSINANVMAVTNALNYTNDLSSVLGGHATDVGVPSISVTGGGSIMASSGFLEPGQTVDGNATGPYRLFNVSSVNFSNGTFTINGSATDQVVLDVGSSANFHGVIVLAGGITSDNVVINMFGGTSFNGTIGSAAGGPALDVNTNGLVTTGTFLDPNGAMSLTHAVLNGRFFGGDSTNQQIVSGANINAPVGPNVGVVPEPSSGVVAAFVGLIALGWGGVRRVRNRSARPSAA